MRSTDIANLIRGPVGTRVSLALWRPHNSPPHPQSCISPLSLLSPSELVVTSPECLSVLLKLSDELSPLRAAKPRHPIHDDRAANHGPAAGPAATEHGLGKHAATLSSAACPGPGPGPQTPPNQPSPRGDAPPASRSARRLQARAPPARACRLAPLHVCTAPLTQYRYCVPEKYEWVERHLGADFIRNVVIAKDKTLVRGDVLIDDRPEITGHLAPAWRPLVYDQPYNRARGGPRMTWANWREAIAGMAA